MTEIQHILESEKPFKKLSPTELLFLSKHTTFDNFKKDDFIKPVNNSATIVYFLNKGFVKRGQYSKEGKEYASKFFIPKSIFGIFSLLETNEDKEFYYQALTTCEVICIKRSALLKIITENALFGKAILELTIKKSLELEKNQFNLVFNNIEGRVAYFLLQLANDFGRKIGNEILIEHIFTQQDMSNFIGLTRQTVNQALVIFKEKEYIYIPDRKKILIKNSKQLEKIAMY